jgi:hypothetical protein
VWLEDRLLGSFTDISNNGNYISYMDAVNTEDRYFLHFAPSITSITEQGNPAGIKTYTSGNELYVLFTNIPETSGTLKLVDLLGQEIVIKNNVSTKNNVCILNLPTLSAGVYTISFITEAKVYSSKLFIR